MLEIDVLVVGGGGAAARAAIEAHDAGARVLLVTKGKLGKSGTTAHPIADTAGLAIADGLADPTDSPEVHLQDVLTAGMGMCDEKLSRILTREAIDIVQDLENIGVDLMRDEDGSYLRTKACFSSKARNYRVKGHGIKIINALTEQIRRRGINIMEDSMLVDVVVENNRVVGALLLKADGSLLRIHTGAVVLGTGGAVQLFQYNLNPPDVSGDGYAIGFRAGAKLVNMEFMQYGIGALPSLNLGYWMWGFIPVLTNGEGREFVQSYLPEGIASEEVVRLHSTHFPFTSRLLSRYLELAIQGEIVAGRTSPKGGVFVDYTNRLNRPDLPDNTRRLWKKSQEFLGKNGLDITTEPVEVANFAQAINGGLRINEYGESTVNGLFAVGENAGGPHGADRLGGGMLTAGQVFGKRAGIAAAKIKKQETISPLLSQAGERLEKRLENMRAVGKTGEYEVGDLRRELQKLSNLYLMINRKEESLVKYIEGLAKLETRLNENTKVASVKDLHNIMEMRNLLQTGRMIAEVALMRKETRGSHLRSDYPQTSLESRWIFVSKTADDSLDLSFVPVGSY